MINKYEQTRQYCLVSLGQNKLSQQFGALSDLLLAEIPTFVSEDPNVHQVHLENVD